MLDNPSHHVGYVGRCLAHHSTLMSKTLSGDIMLITATKYGKFLFMVNLPIFQIFISILITNIM
jgi:hypothetical protein